VYLVSLVAVVAVLTASYFMFHNKDTLTSANLTASVRSSINTMEILSSDFQDNGSIPSQFTCDGANVSPNLSFSEVPQEAVSLALIMEDPDVPKTVRADGMWDHWLVWNISPKTNGVQSGERVVGTYGNNTGGKPEYGGPCPPDREHRYFFTLYALDSTIDLPQGSSKQELLNAMNGHVLAQAQLVGKYNRSK
jgi:Raf kinase inhibitor-like YbhB/YbcL family protein